MKKLLTVITICLFSIPVSLASNPPAIDGTYTSHTTYQFDYISGSWVVCSKVSKEMEIVLNENYIRIDEDYFTTGEKLKIKYNKKSNATEYSFKIQDGQSNIFYCTLVIFELQGLETKPRRQFYISNGEEDFSYDLI